MPGREKIKYRSHEVRMRLHTKKKKHMTTWLKKSIRRKEALKRSTDFILIGMRLHWRLLEGK